MTESMQYAPSPASDAQFCRFWSAQVDALEHHLATNTSLALAVAVAVIAFPLARIAIPVIIHNFVPDVVWSVLSWM